MRLPIPAVLFALAVLPLAGVSAADGEKDRQEKGAWRRSGF